MRFRAAIFDLDGTLVDNMGYHLRAWQALARKLGLEVSAERFERDFAGRKNDEIFPALLGREVPPAELKALAEEKEAAYRDLYLPHLAPLAGAESLLDLLAASGCRLAVASAAPRANREMVLGGLGWVSRFERIIGAEDAARGKPAPDLYLAAAKALGVDPAECVAFEDAVHGVTSAVSAGMAAAAVLTTTPAEVLIGSGARWTMRDFTAIPRDLEAALLGP